METKETKINFSTKHPIADVETPIDLPCIGGTKKFDYLKGEVCIAGFFVDDKITQFLLMNKSKSAEFCNNINSFLSTINGKQLHSFNINMESGCFTNLLKKSLSFNEIQPFHGKGINKEYCFGYLIKKKQCLDMRGIVGFDDPLNGDSSKLPDYWNKGLYEECRRHNVGCLVKEAKILQYRDFLIKEHSNLLDGNGWLRNGALLPSLK